MKYINFKCVKCKNECSRLINYTELYSNKELKHECFLCKSILTLGVEVDLRVNSVSWKKG